MGSGSGDEDEDVKKETHEAGSPGQPKKAGRRKINIEFIEDKSRRHITFSKRKAGIMKKAYELSTLTGTQVLLLVASETGHVYTFATPKLQPLITKPEGKNLIQSCLNAPEATPTSPPPPHHPPRLTQQQPHYTEPAPMLYPPGDAIYPGAEHPSAGPQSASYDKDDKDHRGSARQQDIGKGLHMDVAQMPSHMGMGYGGPYPNAPTSSMNMMAHPLNNMGGMNGYGQPGGIPRYIPAPSGQHPSNAGAASGPNSQYAQHPYPSPAVGMLGYQSSGFGGGNPPYGLWSGTHSSGASSSAPHSDGGKGGNDNSHHAEESPST
jgi:hypothetical protein